jgi:hypothetical protein
MSVHDEFCGRGIGSALLAALIDLSDNWLNLKRLELTVYVDNEPALRLYRKCGFEAEGTRRRDVFRDGHYVGSVLHGATTARMEPTAMTLEAEGVYYDSEDHADGRADAPDAESNRRTAGRIQPHAHREA